MYLPGLNKKRMINSDFTAVYYMILLEEGSRTSLEAREREREKEGEREREREREEEDRKSVVLG